MAKAVRRVTGQRGESSDLTDPIKDSGLDPEGSREPLKSSS